MLTRAALALLTMLLTATCAAPSDGPACPQEVVYSKPMQALVAIELAGLPKDSLIRNVYIPDYGRLRDQARACRGETVRR